MKEAANEPWAELVALSPATSSVIIDVNPFVVGRNPTCSHALSNPCLSSVHCVLTLLPCDTQEAEGSGAPRRSTIADMSSNGCYVNGEKVGKGNSRVLSNGDIVALVLASKEVHRQYNLVYRFQFSERQQSLSHGAASIAPIGEAVPLNLDCGLPQRRDDLYTVNFDACLGSGSFASVYKGTRKRDNLEVAVKIINKRRALGLAPQEDHMALERQQRESSILKAVEYPFVTRVFDVFEDPDDGTVSFVLELAEGGELFSLVKEQGLLSEQAAKIVLFQLLSGVEYLHSIGVVHRDIKLENILLAHKCVTAAHEVDKSKILVKIADFGLARVLGSSQQVMSTLCGTPLYVAPEVIVFEAREVMEGYTPSVDLWSVGVVGFALVTGRPPYTHVRDSKGNKTQKVDYSKPLEWRPSTSAGQKKVSEWKVSVNCRDLIVALLRRDPAKRITATEALKHPWFADLSAEERAIGFTSYTAVDPSATRKRLREQ